MAVPTPSVDLSEGGARDRVTETALDRVDALANIFEASDDLRDVVGVPVTKTQLSIRVIFTNGVDQTLAANEETKVIAAADPTNRDLTMERHLYRDAVLLSRFHERPCESQAILRCCECQVSTS